MAADFDAPEPLEAFVDDEGAYNDWYRQHWQGYVLNAARKPSAHYLMLHRVPCMHLEGDVPWTTTDQSKVCSPTKEDIDSWTMVTCGIHADRCSTCQP